MDCSIESLLKKMSIYLYGSKKSFCNLKQSMYLQEKEFLFSTIHFDLIQIGTKQEDGAHDLELQPLRKVD